MITGGCLCGDVAFTVAGPLELTTHCHCARCRKSHGADYSTSALTPADGFHVTRGADRVTAWATPDGASRHFCGRCGSCVPGGEPWEGRVFVPLGLLDGEPDATPTAHIFVASKAPWVEIRDGLPQFDAFPPGIDAAALPDRAPLDPPGLGPRGSCTCGGVTFVVTGKPLRSFQCHCGRCRKARAAAHATNFFTALDGVRFTRGADQVGFYKLPAARYFGQAFCRVCGGGAPRLDPDRGIAIMPMGVMDDPPGITFERHIWVGSKAAWDPILDDRPQDDGPPPSA